jgi:hypothetical protein
VEKAERLAATASGKELQVKRRLLILLALAATIVTVVIAAAGARVGTGTPHRSADPTDIMIESDEGFIDGH